MSSPALTFSHLLSPTSVDTFFDDVFGRRPLHIAGPPEKFRNAFSWTDLNHLLEMSGVWSDRSMKLVLDGRDVEPSDYSFAGMSREGHQALLPDATLLEDHLRRGATLILDLVETLSPGICAMTRALASGTGSAIVCNAYCSWRAHQGFMAHYDTTDVFALHIEGSKTWRVYQGVADEPANLPGYRSSDRTPDQHARARGNLLMEVNMTPGDLLYLPRGQYHEALASSDASLHLSFGITRATGLDFVAILARWLREDPAFRKVMPHFDDAEGHQVFLRNVAAELRRKASDRDLAADVRAWQCSRAFRSGVRRFRLPQRASECLYRLRRRGLRIENDAGVPRVNSATRSADLSAGEAAAVECLLGVDVATFAELSELWTALNESEARALAEKLLKAGVIEEI